MNDDDDFEPAPKNASYWKRQAKKAEAALDVAMTVLGQIATTPRNRGAKRRAYAANEFIKANFRASDA